MAKVSTDTQRNPAWSSAVSVEFRAAVQVQLDKVLDEVMVQFETHVGGRQSDALLLAPSVSTTELPDTRPPLPADGELTHRLFDKVIFSFDKEISEVSNGPLDQSAANEAQQVEGEKQAFGECEGEVRLTDVPEDLEGIVAEVVGDGCEEEPGAVGDECTEEPGRMEFQPHDPGIHKKSIRKSKSGLEQSYTDKIHKTKQNASGDIIGQMVARRSVCQETWYECCVGVLIVFNAVYLGWQVQYKATHGQASASNDYMVAFFCTVFTLDVLIRLRFFKIEFFTGSDVSWNVFDFVIVSMMLLDQFLSFALDGSDELSNFSALRVLRLLRLLRVLRILRVLTFFKEFRLLCGALMSGSTWRTFLWIFLLIFMMLYMTALALAQSALENCIGPDASPDLCRHFGSLPQSFFTIYKVIYGGIVWGDLIEALDPLGELPKIMLGGFVLFSNSVVLNCVMALIFKVVIDVAEQLQDYRMLIQETEHNSAFVQLMSLFLEMDIDGSRSLSVGEFDLAMQNPKICIIFQALKLETNDMSELFNMLDLEGTGEVEIDVFVNECMRLRGEARAIDIWQLQTSTKEIETTLDGIVKMLEKTSQGTSADPIMMDAPESNLVLPELSMASTGTLCRHPHAEASYSDICKAQTSLLDMLKDRVHSGKPIKRVEMRSMSLHELRGMHMWIKRMCHFQMWKHHRTGKQLCPEEVNLYHINHYVICPVGVTNGVVLQGLEEGVFKQGQKVVQRFPDISGGGDAWAVPVAEGVVHVDAKGTLLHVRVMCGRFEFGSHPHAGNIEIDGQSYGRPTNVDAINALSYKEVIASKPLDPLWYVSHFWGEPVLDFISCCAEHAMRWGMDDKVASYWVCGYANRQYRLQDEICDNLENSAFRRAMRLAKGTLLILDRDAIPFDRIWCDFEISKTLAEPKLTLDMVTMIDGPDGNREAVLLSESNPPFESVHAKTLREECFPISLIVKGMRCKLEAGESTVPSDKQNILRNVMEMLPQDRTTLRKGDTGTLIDSAFDQLDNSLHAYFALAVWPQAVRRGVVSKLSLPHVLKSDTERTSLSLDLAQSQELDDAGIAALADGFSLKLKHLHINFKQCGNITDQGVTELAQSLPPQLQSLQLNFEGCEQITDIGLIFLAGRIGCLKSLQQLRVDFAMCPDIDIPGLQALADETPRSVTDFVAVLLGTQANCNVKSIKELHHIRRNAGVIARLQRDKAGAD